MVAGLRRGSGGPGGVQTQRRTPGSIRGNAGFRSRREGMQKVLSYAHSHGLPRTNYKNTSTCTFASHIPQKYFIMHIFGPLFVTTVLATEPPFIPTVYIPKWPQRVGYRLLVAPLTTFTCTFTWSYSKRNYKNTFTSTFLCQITKPPYKSTVIRTFPIHFL